MKIVRRKDRVIGWECGETGRPGGRPLRVHGKGAVRGRPRGSPLRTAWELVRADAGIGPYGCVAGDGPLHEGKLIG